MFSTNTLGKLFSLAGGAASLTNPFSLCFNGARSLGGFLFQTTLGRLSMLAVVMVVSFSLFKAHFARIERGAWETAVHTKQIKIDDKVVAIERDTKERQDNARKNISITDSVLSVITGSLWRLDDKHPVDGEIIDLINETRDNRRSLGSAEGGPIGERQNF